MRLHWHIIGSAALFVYFLFRLSKTLSTLLDDTTPYVLSKDELGVSTQAHNQSDDGHSIPRIIHQVYLGWDGIPMPKHWIKAQATCVGLHPDYEYKLWNQETARNLLSTDYPWFLNTWDNYRYPVQKADSIRYFILVKYGGIYIDLDNGCKRRLDPLLEYPAWMPGTTNRLGLTNHIMASMRDHPYFQLLVGSLKAYDRNWGLPYLTIMNSAGPHFVSMVWDEYLKTAAPHETVRILSQEEYEGYPWSFFTKEEGGTWHHWSPDEVAFKWMGHHVILVATVAFVGIGIAAVILWWVGLWLVRWTFSRRRRGTDFLGTKSG